MSMTNEPKSNKRVRTSIRYYRVTEGYTQEDIANALDVSTAHYSHIENGDYIVSWENLDIISDFLKIEPYIFLKEDHTKDDIPGRSDFYTGKRKSPRKK